MDTKDLQAFIQMYEQGSITAAAGKLFITPQGLSLTLKRMEAELDSQLFIRSSHGITPTPMAHALYGQAAHIMEELENIRAGAGIRDAEGRYMLNVASTLGVMDYLTIRFIKQYRQTHPQVRLTIIENPDRAVKERLLNEEAEVGFLSGPIDTTLFDAVPFTQHHHCLVIHASHPLAEKSSVSYMDLDRMPLALEGRDFMSWHNNMNRFVRAGAQPDIIMETTEIVSTHKIAAMNEGIGLSVDFPAWNHPEPGTVIRPFSDPDCIWETFIVTQAGRKPSREADEFMEFAHRWLRKNKQTLFHWPAEYDDLNDWYRL